MTLPRTRTLAALLATVLLAGACEDPFPEPELRTNLDVPLLEAWAMTGSSPALPTAMAVPVHTVIRTDAAGSFDIAFDIDADGRLRVIPVSLVVTPLTGTRAVGLQAGVGNYTTIVEAPRDGWVFDSVLTVNPGGSFLVKAQTAFCRGDFRPDIYAKFYVDSVLPAERRIRISTRVNPNCGYRQLSAGVPTF